MKFQYTMLVVRDIEKSKQFYKDVLGVKILADWGANVTFTGGFLAIQSRESYGEFLEKSPKEISFGSLNSELYFTETQFDKFLIKLNSLLHIEQIGEVKEADWGQRVVRFYDPDKHIIEVGEDLKIVCQRLAKEGFSLKEICKKTYLPERFVKLALKQVC